MQQKPEDLKPWELLSDEVVLTTPWFAIHNQHMRTDKQKEVDYYVHDFRDGVMCVCVNSEGNVLIEAQYRPPVDKISYDYPAGGMETKDASPEAAMIRELEEETGLRATSVKKLGVIDKDPGYTKTRMHIFLVQGTVETQTSPDETESIVSMFVSPAEIIEMITSGKLVCGCCVSATYLAFKELGWLQFTLPNA